MVNYIICDYLMEETCLRQVKNLIIWNNIPTNKCVSLENVYLFQTLKLFAFTKIKTNFHD